VEINFFLYLPVRWDDQSITWLLIRSQTYDFGLRLKFETFVSAKDKVTIAKLLIAVG